MPLETYTKYLPEPSPYIQGSVPGTDSTAAAIGAGLTGLATIFDIGLKTRREDRVSKNLNEFENEISPFVQSVSQGRMSSNDALARTSAIMKAHIDRNPTMANDFRQRGQDIWGTNSSAEVLKLQQSLEGEARTRKTAEEDVFIKAALQAGIQLDDRDAMIKAGAGISRNSFVISRVGEQLDNELAAAQLEERRTGKPQTIQERGAAEWDLIQQPLIDTVREMENSGWSVVSKAIEANRGLAQPDQERAAGMMIRDLEANALRKVQADMHAAGTPFLGETQDRALKAVKDYFAPYHELLANKDFSNLQAWKNTHDQIESRWQGEFQRSSPFLAKLTTQYGQPAVSAIVGSAISTIPRATYRIQAEVLGNVTGQQTPPPPPAPDLSTLLQLNGEVAAGRGSVMSNPNSAYTRAQTQSLTAAQEALGRNHTKIQPQELDTWGNVQTDLFEFTLQSGNAASVKSLMDRLSTPTQLAVFDKFAKQEPIRATELARKYLQLNSMNIDNVALSIKDPMNIGFKKGSAPGQAYYHALSGQVAWKSRFPPPLEVKQNIERINASLRNVLHFQKYGPDNIQTMKPQELKYQLIKNSGLAIKGQTPEQLKESDTSTANPTE